VLAVAVVVVVSAVEAVEAVNVVADVGSEAVTVALAAVVIEAAAVPFLLVVLLSAVQGSWWALRAIRILSLLHTLRLSAKGAPDMGTRGYP
jgi:hypothetical protein